MAINLSQLELTLTSLSKTADNAADRLLLTKIINKLRQSGVSVTGSVSTLPDVNSVADGSIYLVESEGRLYVSRKLYSTWQLLTDDYFGMVLGWGYGLSGNIGDGATTNKSSPVSVVGGFTDWCQVSTGTYQTIAVRKSGSAWAWGSNNLGRLGDNTTVGKSSPVSVVGGFTDWCQVSTNYHSLGVRTNGTLWAWGPGSCGKLGDNTIVNKSSPVSVVGGFTDWTKIKTAGNSSIGLRSNGTIWVWGCNSSGILGDGTTVNKSSPVSVLGGFTDWIDIAGGVSHKLGLRSNGSLWAWGINGDGQLGDNSTINKTSPVSVIGGFVDWCTMSGGSAHSAAIRTNGSLWTWGFNSVGELGDNSLVAKSSPVSVSGGFTDWCQVTTGRCATVAVRATGSAWSWGYNSSGQLGDLTVTNKSSPVSVVGGVTWSNVDMAPFGRTVAGLIKKTF